MGRPTKLTASISEAILKQVRAGIPETTAARAAGISRSAFEGWKRRGLEGSQPYANFVNSLMCARAQGEAALVASIIQASRQDVPGDWRASAWLLSHSGDWRQRWGQPEQLREAQNQVLALVVKTIEAEISDPAQRQRLLTALVANGCGLLPEERNDEA